MTKPRIILIGAGGHCRSCIDVIEQENRFDILGIVEKAGLDMTNSALGYPLLGTDDDLPALKQECKYALVTVGQIKSVAVRIRLFNQLTALGFELPSIISPLAYVSRHAKIAKGTIVMHQALVNANALVGSNCILNTRCLVEHDAVIGDHAHVSTGAVINGNAKVGKHSFVGSGATVIHGITLPEGSFVRAGQLVASDKDYRVLEND
jgi:sugar O-acyltransferase (sialic acid O-acetyltransferase NeuD family)